MKRSHTSHRSPRNRLSFEPLESRRVLAAVFASPQLSDGIGEVVPLNTPNQPVFQQVRPIAGNSDILGQLSVDVPLRTPSDIYTLGANNSISPAELDSIFPNRIVPAQSPTDQIQVAVDDRILDSVVITESTIRIDTPETSFWNSDSGSVLGSSSVPQTDAVSDEIVTLVQGLSRDSPGTYSVVQLGLTDSVEALLNAGSVASGINSLLDVVSDSSTYRLDSAEVGFENPNDIGMRSDVGSLDHGLSVHDGEVFNIEEIIEFRSVGADETSTEPGLENSEVSTIGSTSIVDDPDTLPQIESGTDSVTGSSVSSALFTTVDIARNFAVSNLNQVSRRSTLPAQSSLIATLETGRAVVSGDDSVDVGSASRRAHFSTHASVASLRRMEIIEATPMGVELSSVKSVEAPLATVRSVISAQAKWRSQTNSVRMDSPSILPSYPRWVEEDDGLMDVETREKVEKERLQRTSMKMELGNPLVSVSLLIFSCVGGLVLSRTLDPDDSQGSNEILL